MLTAGCARAGPVLPKPNPRSNKSHCEARVISLRASSFPHAPIQFGGADGRDFPRPKTCGSYFGAPLHERFKIFSLPDYVRLRLLAI